MSISPPSAAAPSSTAAAQAIDARKVYGKGDTEVVALDDVSVTFETARFTAIMGPSGSGKSTLMHCVAGLDDARPAAGSSSATPTSPGSPTSS